MIKLQSFNDQEKCLELAAADIAVFRCKQLITIVQTIVPSQNLVQCSDIIYYNKTTKFELPCVELAGASIAIFQKY